jgi:hypothetical protein
MATCTGSQVSVQYDNGSLNIMTVNGTVMVDQLDLKQAIASLQTNNAHLRSELSKSQLTLKKHESGLLAVNAVNTNLSSELSTSQSALQQQQASLLAVSDNLKANVATNLRMSATVERLEAATRALNQYFPERYFDRSQLVISTAAIQAWCMQPIWTMTVTWMCSVPATLTTKQLGIATMGVAASQASLSSPQRSMVLDLCMQLTWTMTVTWMCSVPADLTTR